MDTKKWILKHFKVLQSALDEVNAEAYMNAKTFNLEVHFGMQSVTLYPQFIINVEGEKFYTPNFTADALRFIGWRPYYNKAVEFMVDKLETKSFLAANDIRVPEFSDTEEVQLENVIVKRRVSSFGNTIKGPFANTRSYRLNEELGEYFERLIPGEIVKIWYWNETPVCLEAQNWPNVVGNGRASIAQMLAKRIHRPLDKGENENVAATLAWFGKSLDSVPAEGEEVPVDFRYGSRFMLGRAIRESYFMGKAPEEAGDDLVRIGQVLWEKIRSSVRGSLAYTVDAIRDADGAIWVLEANPNPFMHPALYRPIIKELAEAVQERIVADETARAATA